MLGDILADRYLLSDLLGAGGWARNTSPTTACSAATWRLRS